MIRQAKGCVLVVAILMALGMGAWLTTPAYADTVTYDLYVIFDQDPDIINDFGDVKISTITDGKLQFDISIDNTIAGFKNADLNQFFFNFSFQWDKNDVSVSVVTPDELKDDLDYNKKADGDGTFDVAVKFTQNKYDGLPHQSSFILTYKGRTLTLNDVFALSDVGSSAPQGLYYYAAHVQNVNVNNKDSVWIGTADPPVFVGPLPSSALLVGSGLLGLVLVGRRLRQRR